MTGRAARTSTTRRLAHELAAEVAATGGPWHVLVAADRGRAPDSVDLRALCADRRRPGPRDRARWTRPRPAAATWRVFLLSGGTTGLPKLIARTHDDYAYNARASAELCRARRRTPATWSALPAGHNFPLACPGILGTLLSGGAGRSCCRRPSRSGPSRPSRPRGSPHTAVVPAVAQRWLEHAPRARRRPARARCGLLQVGGARLADELARQVRPVLGATLQQVFGMAEGLLNYTRLDDPDEVDLHHPGPAAQPGRRGAAGRRARPGRRRRASRARCSPAARTPRAATTGPPSRTPARSPPTAGTAAATSAAGRPTATSSSRAATRT